MKASDLHKISDRDLLAALQVMQAGLAANAAAYGVTAGDATALDTQLTEFETSLNDLDAKLAATSAAYGTRDNKRLAVVENTRLLMKKVRVAVGNDKALLEAVNMDEYDLTGTAAGAPLTAPVALVDYDILKHTINFRDAANPDKRGKPNGILGAEIWRKVGGEAPSKDSDYQMVALDTATPFILQYPMEDQGKKVWYRLRWVSRSGEKGGWSETVEATVNG